MQSRQGLQVATAAFDSLFVHLHRVLKDSDHSKRILREGAGQRRVWRMDTRARRGGGKRRRGRMCKGVGKVELKLKEIDVRLEACVQGAR